MVQTQKPSPFFFIFILLLEIFALTENFQLPPFYPAYPETLSSWLVTGSKDFWQIALWMLGSYLFFISPKYHNISNYWQESSFNYHHNKWLFYHLVSFTGFTLLTYFFFEKLKSAYQPSYLYLLAWLLLAALTFCLWLISIAPSRFWLWLFRNTKIELIAGISFGVCAWLLTGMLNRQEAPLGQRTLWAVLSRFTLEIVYILLGYFYSGLVYDPDMLVVGTSSFPLEISYACSGIEGVSLIFLFISMYLWLFKNELRFPNAFWLYPIGIVTIWLSNCFRIFLMIAVGTSYSKEIASRSLHAQAGWIVFTLVAIGIIALSHHAKLFSRKINIVETNNKPAQQANALLVPFLAQLAITMLIAAFNEGFDRFYPVKIIVISAALAYFWKFYRSLSCWQWSWQAIAIGASVFVFWLMLAQENNHKAVALAKGIGSMTDSTAALWLIFRLLGSSIIIPIAEELAFRAYLMRKLIANDFATIPIGRFSLFSFLASSVLFGLLHDRWFAGMIAGMCYAGALYKRKQLGDAVIAHMTTNFLISGYVLTAHKWSLWA